MGTGANGLNNAFRAGVSGQVPVLRFRCRWYVGTSLRQPWTEILRITRLPADLFDVDGVGSGLGSLAADLDVIRAALVNGNGNQGVLSEPAVGVKYAARLRDSAVAGLFNGARGGG